MKWTLKLFLFAGVVFSAQVFSGPIKPLVGTPRNEEAKSCAHYLISPYAHGVSARFVRQVVEKYPINPKLRFKIETTMGIKVTVEDLEGGTFKNELYLDIQSFPTLFVAMTTAKVAYNNSGSAEAYSDITLALNALNEKVFTGFSPDQINARGFNFIYDDYFQNHFNYFFVKVSLMNVGDLEQSITAHLRILEAWAEHLKELSQKGSPYYDDGAFTGYVPPAAKGK